MILFVDPASISSGWALFDKGAYVMSGTIAYTKYANPGLDRGISDRIYYMESEYWLLLTRLDVMPTEAHIERLPLVCHHYTHWSVGAIMAGIAAWGIPVYADISPTAWQKVADWNGKRKPLKKYLKKVKSEDELAAIGMGLYWKEKSGA